MVLSVWHLSRNVWMKQMLLLATHACKSILHDNSQSNGNEFIHSCCWRWHNRCWWRLIGIFFCHQTSPHSHTHICTNKHARLPRIYLNLSWRQVTRFSPRKSTRLHSSHIGKPKTWVDSFLVGRKLENLQPLTLGDHNKLKMFACLTGTKIVSESIYHVMMIKWFLLPNIIRIYAIGISANDATIKTMTEKCRTRMPNTKNIKQKFILLRDDELKWRRWR